MCVCVCALILSCLSQPYYVKNINSGSADGDEALQQVTPDRLSISHSVSQCGRSYRCVNRMFWPGESVRTEPPSTGIPAKPSEHCSQRLGHLEVVLIPCSLVLDPLLIVNCFVVVVALQFKVEDRFLSHPVLQEELTNPKNGDTAYKHLKQQVT